MPLLDLNKITTGLSPTWTTFLGDWDRSLRAGNYPETTRYIYVLAAAQLAWYLGEYSPDPEAAAAADDPVEVTWGHVESFQAWMIRTRSAATALNKHKGLRQFFRWLRDDEEEIERSPMERVRQPKTPQKLIPIIGDEDTAKVLATCVGKGFTALRDEAIIRLLYNTGARLSEVASLQLSDVDLGMDSVCYHGKGGKDRRVRFGPKTGRALSRYLRARAKHKGAGLGELWLAERGACRLGANGIKIMLRRRGWLRACLMFTRIGGGITTPTNGNSPGETLETSCCYSAGHRRTCPATTEPAQPLSEHNKPNNDSASANTSRITPSLTLRSQSTSYHRANHGLPMELSATAGSHRSQV